MSLACGSCIALFIMILQQKPVVVVFQVRSLITVLVLVKRHYIAYRRGARCLFPSKEHAGNRPCPFNVIQNYSLLRINYRVLYNVKSKTLYFVVYNHEFKYKI